METNTAMTEPAHAVHPATHTATQALQQLAQAGAQPLPHAFRDLSPAGAFGTRVPTRGLPQPHWVASSAAVARELGLDVDRFADALRRHTHVARIDADLESADLSGVRGTPTFFVNGRRHHGAFDTVTLEDAVEAARARAYADGWQPPEPGETEESS